MTCVSMSAPLAGAVLKLAASAAAAAVLAACSAPEDGALPGYAEADYVRMAAPIAGTLTRLHLQRGDRVEAGAPAFVLEQDSERAAREEAQARVRQAEAQLANLRKGKRPDEVAAAQAQLAQAEAALALSAADLLRQQDLVAQHFVAPARLDEARAARDRDRQRVNELRAQLRVAKLGARADEIAAADQAVRSARAQLAQAEWKLAQKTLEVPLAASVQDVLYRVGEWVPAGSPVVSLLPPANIKARFFVPEARLGSLRIGQEVRLSCDGCGAPLAAKLSYIAPEAEYTAPLIYSRENRASLVFMIEARPAPADAQRLHPGQPLQVTVLAPAAAPAAGAAR